MRPITCSGVLEEAVEDTPGYALPTLAGRSCSRDRAPRDHRWCIRSRNVGVRARCPRSGDHSPDRARRRSAGPEPGAPAARRRVPTALSARTLMPRHPQCGRARRAARHTPARDGAPSRPTPSRRDRRHPKARDVPTSGAANRRYRSQGADRALARDLPWTHHVTKRDRSRRSAPCSRDLAHIARKLGGIRALPEPRAGNNPLKLVPGSAGSSASLPFQAASRCLCASRGGRR
jgi:hypothetical protein